MVESNAAHGPTPCLARSADGRLELFIVGIANGPDKRITLWHSWQTAPNNGWSNWVSHGAPNGYGFLTPQAESADIAVGKYPTFLAINRQGTRLYVSNGGEKTVSMINTATNAVVATVAVGDAPERPSLTPDEARLFVGHKDGLAVINTSTNQVVAELPIKPYACDVAFTGDGKRGYVIQTDGLLSVVDTTTYTVLATIKVSNASGTRVVIRPDGKRVYVTYETGVAVIDTATNTVIAKIQLAGENDGPTDLEISPDGTRLYASVQTEGTVRVIDTASNNVVAAIPVIFSCASIALNRDGTRALGSNPGSYVTGSHPMTYNVLSMIDTTTKAVTGTIDVGLSPGDVVFSPDGTRAYVSRFVDNAVSVVKLPEGL